MGESGARCSTRCAAARARIASPERERLLPLAQVLVGAGEDDLDFADPAADDVGKAHERGNVSLVD